MNQIDFYNVVFEDTKLRTCWPWSDIAVFKVGPCQSNVNHYKAQEYSEITI